MYLSPLAIKCKICARKESCSVWLNRLMKEGGSVGQQGGLWGIWMGGSGMPRQSTEVDSLG